MTERTPPPASHLRLRPVKAAEIHQDGERLFLVSDPTRPSGPRVVMSPAALALASLLDGTRDVAELAREFHRQHGVTLDPGAVDHLLAELDQALLLDNPRYRADLEARREAYRREPFRPMILAPEMFPAEPEGAAAFLDGLFVASEGPGRLPFRSRGQVDSQDPVRSLVSGPLPGESCRGLLAPHIDFPRGDGLYGQAYLQLAEHALDTDLFLLIGTDHRGELERPVTLTAHDFETPFGRLGTDHELVWELASSRPWLDNELAHRDEHSVELQAVLLHHLLLKHVPGAGPDRARRARVVPVLCGPLVGSEPDPSLLRARREEVDALVEGLLRATRGRPYFVIAGADLAHLGPAFGTALLPEADRRRLAMRDAMTLLQVITVDPEAFLDDAFADGNVRQICSVTAIYVALRLLAGCRGKLLGYRQCPVPEEPEFQSLVSIAAAAFYG